MVTWKGNTYDTKIRMNMILKQMGWFQRILNKDKVNYTMIIIGLYS